MENPEKINKRHVKHYITEDPEREERSGRSNIQTYLDTF